MNEFLVSIKEDLLDRRRLPYLIVLSVAFVGVLAFALVAGGSSSTSSTPSAPPSSEPSSAGGISVSKAPSTAVTAEVSTGNPKSDEMFTRNYFEPLAKEAPPAATSAKASSASSSSSSTSGGSGSSGSSSSPPPAKEPSSSKPTTPPKPSTPPKPKEKIYDVALLFGVSSPDSSQLTPFENAKRGLQLPSKQVPLVTFTGWSAGGKGATFKLNGEAILHGDGVCLPSPAQCETLELAPSKAEQLEYLPSGGTAVTYELQVVSIQPSATKAAAAKAARAAFSGLLGSPSPARP